MNAETVHLPVAWWIVIACLPGTERPARDRRQTVRRALVVHTVAVVQGEWSRALIGNLVEDYADRPTGQNP
ncbi:hypothetical protein [Streptomyces sp. NPDC055058]